MNQLFLGNEQMTVDQKGRVGIPARFMAILRAEFPDRSAEVGVTITQDFSIKIMPLPLFEAELERVQKLSDFVAEERLVKQEVTAFAERLPLDSQNRIKLNPLTMEMCGIDQKVVIVGNAQYMQLYDLEGWKAMRRLNVPRLGQAESAIATRGTAKPPVQYVIQAPAPDPGNAG